MLQDAMNVVLQSIDMTLFCIDEEETA